MLSSGFVPFKTAVQHTDTTSMRDHMSRPAKPHAPGHGDEPAGEEGHWELDLWNGAARFSVWFHKKLQWPTDARRRRLDDLKPNLAPGAWEILLQGIRAHLEQQAPLEVQIEVRLPGGASERWQVQGAVERTPAGQPMNLAGTMCNLKPPQ
jgi:hypothetical protein